VLRAHDLLAPVTAGFAGGSDTLELKEAKGRRRSRPDLAEAVEELWSGASFGVLLSTGRRGVFAPEPIG
jgi:hypothetical protein